MLLINSASKFCGAHANFNWANVSELILGNSLTIVNGKRWLKMRKLLTPAFHAEILKPYTKLFQESTRTLLVGNYRRRGTTLRTAPFVHTYNHIYTWVLWVITKPWNGCRCLYRDPAFYCLLSLLRVDCRWIVAMDTRFKCKLKMEIGR